MRRFEALTQRASIDALLRVRPQLQDATLLRIAARPNHRAAHRAVIIAPKKLFRRAVDRNRIARRSRALLDRLLPEDRGPYDLVILPKPAFRLAPWNELVAAMDALLRQLP